MQAIFESVTTSERTSSSACLSVLPFLSINLDNFSIWAFFNQCTLYFLSEPTIDTSVASLFIAERYSLCSSSVGWLNICSSSLAITFEIKLNKKRAVACAYHHPQISDYLWIKSLLGNSNYTRSYISVLSRCNSGYAFCNTCHSAIRYSSDYLAVTLPCRSTWS